jgi:hypothetical protein
MSTFSWPARRRGLRQEGGFPSALFGLDMSSRSTWEPVSLRHPAALRHAPDAFAWRLYDAVRVARHRVRGDARVDERGLARGALHRRGRQLHGTTGWTVLNARGDRQFADFDFWAIRPSGSRRMTRVGATRPVPAR